jgi:uncharacterized protein (DUF2252 family)
MSKGSGKATVTEEILRFNRGRKPRLLRLKYERLAQDPFAFFRGTDHLLVGSWPKIAPADVGPRGLSCGDLHIENFGAYRSEEGEFLFDINDFDEALVCPCGTDLVRASASILLGCDAWNIPRDNANADVAGFLSGYRKAVAEACREREPGRIDLRSGHGAVWDLLGETAGSPRTELLNRSTELNRRGDRRHLVRIPGKFFDVSDRCHARVARAVRGLGKRLGRSDAYKVRDVVGRIAGVGSLGLPRFVALLDGDGSRDGCWLLDVKQARAPSLLPIAAGAQPDLGRNHAKRTATAQRALQSSPASGLNTLKMRGVGYRVRRLIPDENRSSLDHLHKKKKTLAEAVETLGRITAWSHYRGCRFLGGELVDKLARWAESPAIEAIPEAAMKYAEIVHHQFKSYVRAFEAGQLSTAKWK